VAEADVVAVVSAKSPITALSMSQVADIFFGKASRFPNGVQAFPVDQAEGSAFAMSFTARSSEKPLRRSKPIGQRSYSR
jgi:hypothetical protein